MRFYLLIAAIALFFVTSFAPPAEANCGRARRPVLRAIGRVVSAPVRAVRASRARRAAQGRFVIGRVRGRATAACFR